MLAERITAFVRGEPGDGFDELALAVFADAFERHAAFRELCAARDARPEAVADWRQVPALPVDRDAGPQPGAGRAEPPDELLRAVVDRSFPAACLEGLERPPFLALTPSGATGAGGELGRVTDHLLERWASPDSRVAFGRRGLEVARARGFLAARQRDRRPTLILATPESLIRLLEVLERQGLRFRLPPGSRVVEAGGGGLADRELLARLAQGLAVPAEQVIRAWAIGGLRSWLYAGHGASGRPRPFQPPPWTRARILDPRTGAEPPAGAAGEISVFDLAAIGAPPHRATGELGLGDEGGFQLAS